ncbi:TfoX/Sxy family protein [Azospirillum sp. TSH58]|uniref:TfoX/Sxy family protein n=1 Tax=Azospirillum sp. TSH58 TaxID=664962 RepID=UPI000D6188A4|nr:TfoX/Sxy family protein [Azospirillum sp. TSH58]PWC63950.1 transcriptional regulator [Azospirillum sp. TSH58]
MARVSELVRFLCESLTPLGDITARRMFGGYAVYCDGVVFALVAHDILYFKADDGNRPDYEALGLRPFKPFDDKPTVLPYFPPPDSALDDPDELLLWARPALAAAIRTAAIRKPARKNVKA